MPCFGAKDCIGYKYICIGVKYLLQIQICHAKIQAMNKEYYTEVRRAV